MRQNADQALPRWIMPLRSTPPPIRFLRKHCVHPCFFLSSPQAFLLRNEVIVMSTELSPAHYDLRVKRDLGNGLLLRWSEANDTEELVYLTGIVFRDGADEPPNTRAENLVRELMSGRQPLMGPRDFIVIEDTRRTEHRMVACTCFWSQTWEYEGIRFGFGRPEIVGTDPDYRNRGLVRSMFEEIHARSEAEGHLAQGITGIRYFYRQFGYEYALDLGGRRVTNLL